MRSSFGRLGVFKTLEARDAPPAAPIFCDPEALDESLARTLERGHTSSESGKQFFWQYHFQFRLALENLSPHDRPFFQQIKKTKKILESNQRAYVFLRRLTLIAFLLITIAMVPTSISTLFNVNIEEAERVYSWMPQGIEKAAAWILIATLLAPIFFVLNKMLKSFYDNCANTTTSVMSNHLQAYTQALYVQGFKKAMDNINDEEGTFGAHADKLIWPDRAQKWAKIGYWHGKRIEWINRYTQIEVWASQRTLRFTDVMSRIVTGLIILVFFVLMLPAINIEAVDWWTAFGVLWIIGLATIGWDRLGRENLDVFENTMFAPDRQLWIKDAEINESFAAQVLKDKSRIQRARNRGRE